MDKVHQKVLTLISLFYNYLIYSKINIKIIIILFLIAQMFINMDVELINEEVIINYIMTIEFIIKLNSILSLLYFQVFKEFDFKYLCLYSSILELEFKLFSFQIIYEFIKLIHFHLFIKLYLLNLLLFNQVEFF
jgi:hypothetical protein